MALSDILRVDDDPEKIKYDSANPASSATDSGLSSIMKMADNTRAPATMGSFNQNLSDIAKDDPMMNSYYKSNPVDVARAMYNLRKSLNGAGLGSVSGR